jgi:hypothetical protein
MHRDLGNAERVGPELGGLPAIHRRMHSPEKGKKGSRGGSPYYTAGVIPDGRGPSHIGPKFWAIFFCALHPGRLGAASSKSRVRDVVWIRTGRFDGRIGDGNRYRTCPVPDADRRMVGQLRCSTKHKPGPRAIECCHCHAAWLGQTSALRVPPLPTGAGGLRTPTVRPYHPRQVVPRCHSGEVSPVPGTACPL